MHSVLNVRAVSNRQSTRKGGMERRANPPPWLDSRKPSYSSSVADAEWRTVVACSGGVNCLGLLCRLRSFRLRRALVSVSPRVATLSTRMNDIPMVGPIGEPHQTWAPVESNRPVSKLSRPKRKAGSCPSSQLPKSLPKLPA